MEGIRTYNLKLTEKEIRLLIDCLYFQAVKSKQDSEVNFLVRTEAKLFDVLTKH